MFQALWPPVPAEEAPITSVTNGVHGRTWVSSEMDDLLSKYVSPAWDEAGPEEWSGIVQARDDEVWRVREQSREALVTVVRDRLRHVLLSSGASISDAAWTDNVLDPRYLIVGFARRFASYKRATLLLSQPDRLRALLLDDANPMQLVFAGKAHPADEIGKEMISRIVRFSRDPSVRHRIVFVEDYDISVARAITQGSDVWLNTPRRPMEASGTSGEKAALNGALNCSILDGWWDEMFNGRNGWAVSSAESYHDLGRRDEVEADSLFEILERQIVPLYYERRNERFHREWVQRIKESLSSLGPKVQASRMVRDYVETLYEPIAARADAMSEPDHGRAQALARWKQHVVSAWSGVAVLSVATETATTTVDLGGVREVTAEVGLGNLSADDVEVQLIHGQVAVNDELIDTEAIPMKRVSSSGHAASATLTYSGRFTCDQAGRHGYTVRIVPAHADLAFPVEMGCISWA